MASVTARATGRSDTGLAPLGGSLRTSVLAVLALASYAATRVVVGVNDPLGIGLAAIPLFFCAAFLRRTAALALAFATILLTVVPTVLDGRQADLVDLAIAAELSILVLAALALRGALARAAAAAASGAANEAQLNDRLEAVLGIAERLTTTFDRDEIFRTIVTEVDRALGADGTTIRILQGDRSVVVAWAGISDEVAARLPVLGIDEDWFGQVFHERRPVVDTGLVTSDTPHTGVSPYAGVLDVASSIAVPLVLGDRVIGALASFTTAPRLWTPADVEFAVAVATHASIAIHNAELFARTESWAAQLAVLQAASARMSRQNTIESVGRAIVEEVGRIIDYHNCRVYTLEAPDDVVPIAFEGRVGAYEKVDLELLRTKLGEGFTGWVAQHGEPLLVHDANDDPRGSTIPGTDEVDESMLCVPMRYDERVIGVITLSKLGLRQFDEDDQRLLTILADQAATAVESARLLTRSERLAGELRRLLDMSGALSRSLVPAEVAQLIARHLVDALGVDECAVSWWERDANQLTTLGFWPPTDPAEIQAVFELAGFPETIRVLEQQVVSIIGVDDPAADPAEVAYLRSQGCVVSAMFPLVAKGRSVALVELMGRSKVNLDDSALELARTMANEAAMALENARHYDEARKLADRDPLTGFFNHRYLHERLGEEIVRAQRSRRPLAVLMVDLDDFKLVNDTFGHLFGDRVLTWTAEQIRSTLRASDIGARYGGDEFAIILPETDRPAAIRAAARVLRALRDRPFVGEGRGPVPMAASIGVAAFPADGRTGQELIAMADLEMYRVKDDGGAGAAGPGARRVRLASPRSGESAGAGGDRDPAAISGLPLATRHRLRAGRVRADAGAPLVGGEAGAAGSD